jgi:hypothetical protein
MDRGILNLVPTSFGLNVTVDSEYGERIILGGKVRLHREESVQLASDEDFNNLEGVLRLIEHEGEESEKNKALGWMQYVSEFRGDFDYQKATYQIDVQIPRRRLELLLAAVSQGRLPSQIWVYVVGMTYGGGGLVWDNKNCPRLQIESIDLRIPLIGGDPHDFLDERTAEDTMSPTRAQLDELLTKVNRIIGQSNQMVIAVFVILALLLIIVWRGHLRYVQRQKVYHGEAW